LRGLFHPRLAMTEFFSGIWHLVYNVAGLVFLIWLIVQALKSMKGGR
jgi:hypothetical protein